MSVCFCVFVRREDGNDTIRESECFGLMCGAWTSERCCDEGPRCKTEQEREEGKTRMDRYMFTEKKKNKELEKKNEGAHCLSSERPDHVLEISLCIEEKKKERRYYLVASRHGQCSRRRPPKGVKSNKRKKKIKHDERLSQIRGDRLRPLVRSIARSVAFLPPLLAWMSGETDNSPESLAEQEWPGDERHKRDVIL